MLITTRIITIAGCKHRLRFRNIVLSFLSRSPPLSMLKAMENNWNVIGTEEESHESDSNIYITSGLKHTHSLATTK